MGMNLDDWKGLRGQWVKARDNAKPKLAAGAVKGVSMGDAIEDVYKASRKGHLPLSKALVSLQKDLVKYKAAIKATNKDLVSWLEKNVEKPADELLDELGDDVGRLEGIKLEMSTFHSRTDLYFPDGEEFHKVGMQAEKDGVPWQKASKPLFDRLDKSLYMWKNLSKAVTASANSIALSLPVKPGKAELTELAKYFENEINLVDNLAKAKTLDEFQYKAKGCRDSFYMLCITAENTRKAIGKLIP